MARWKHMALAGIVAAGLSLLAGARAEAAPQTDSSYAPGQAQASVQPKIVGGDPVIYLDGRDQISVGGRISVLFPILPMMLKWQKLLV